MNSIDKENQLAKARGLEIIRKVKEFAKDDNSFELITNDTIFTKHKYKDTIFLYSKIYVPYELEYTIESNYEYVGFYNLTQNEFFDLKYPLDLYIDQKTKGLYELRAKLIQEIRYYIAKELTENTALFDEIKENVKINEEYFIREINEDIFNDTGKKNLEDYIDLSFSGYDIPKDKEIKYADLCIILDYINNSEEVIKWYEKEWLEKRLNELFIRYEKYKVYSKKFDEIMNDKLNTIHRKKAVKDAIEDKKTVNVTILKKDKMFTFKTESSVFLDEEERYLLSYIIAPDRKKYDELFSHDSYTFDEILKITYGKNEIYNKEQFENQKH